MKWRRPTNRELRVGLPVLVPVLIVAVFVVRGCHTGDVPHLTAPAGVQLPPEPPSTAPSDLTGVQLPSVRGTTTTIPPRVAGTAHVSGTVLAPQGFVAGATVHFEHIASETVSFDVTAGPDGRYDAPNIAGGRYRVRAFLPPSFAQTDPEVFFLADGEQHPLDLHVDTFTGVAVTSAVAPDPPLFGEPSSFVVRVATRTVDGNGIVRAQPVVNANVTLIGTQGWSVTGTSSTFTDGNGDAAFTLTCRAPGANQVQVTVRPTVNDAPQPSTLTVSACVDNRPTTSSSSSGSSSSGSSSSTAPN